MICPVHLTAQQLSIFLDLPVESVIPKGDHWEVQLTTTVRKKSVLYHDFREIMGTRIRVLLPDEPLVTVEQFRAEAETENASNSLVVKMFETTERVAKRAFERSACGKVRMQYIPLERVEVRNSNSSDSGYLVRLVFADAYCRAVAERTVLPQIVKLKQNNESVLKDDPGTPVQVKKWSRRVRV